jgi:HemY protein
VKTVIFLLIALLASAAGGFFFLREHLATGGGYVIVGMGQWSLETSLLLAGAALLLTFGAFYIILRLLIATVRLPTLLKQRGYEQRSRRSQEALYSGLIETAEGNWETAERQLIRHAADSGAPLINYLTAARAAHSRGALEQSEEYLKLAQESMPEAEIAIGLAKAEFQMSQQQFEQALENLIHLNKIAPSHATVLKMMHQAYAKAEDWEGLSRIIPKLHANKVMMEAEIKALEAETFGALLKKKAEARDAGVLRQLWQEAPQHIRKLPGMQQLYFAAMIDVGAGMEVEANLRDALRKEWSDTLVVLYACIQSDNPAQQLKQAEGWLKARKQDPVLLRVLGKLSARAGLADKAKAYLQSSLAIEPSAEAYQLMGDALLRENDPAGACQYFRNGLMFASNEVVAMIEQNAEEDADAATASAEETH